MDENDLIKMMSQLVGGGGLQGTAPDPQMEILKQGVDTTTKAYEDLLAQQQAQNEPPTGFMAKINNAFNSPATAAALKLIEEGNRKRGLQEGPGTLLGAMPPAVNAFNTQYKSLQDQQTSRLKALMESAQAKRAAQLEMDQFGHEKQKAASEHLGRVLKGFSDMYKALKPGQKVQMMQYLQTPEGEAFIKDASAKYGVSPSDIFTGMLGGGTTVSVNNIDRSVDAELVKIGFSQYQDLMKANEVQRKLAESYTSMETVLNQDSFYSGADAKMVKELKKWGLVFGIPESVLANITGIPKGGESLMEFFQSNESQAALIFRNPEGGGGLPGAASDRDVAFLLSMVPQLSKTKKGNALLIRAMKKSYAYNMAYQKHFGRLLHTHRGAGEPIGIIAADSFKDSEEYKEYVKKYGKNPWIDETDIQWIEKEYGVSAGSFGDNAEDVGKLFGPGRRERREEDE